MMVVVTVLVIVLNIAHELGHRPNPRLQFSVD